MSPYKGITTLLSTPHIVYSPHCTFHTYIHLFCNWKFITFISFMYFSHLPTPSPWQPPVCSRYLWLCICLVMFVHLFLRLHIRVVVAAQLCLTLCNPVNCSMPGFLVLHYLLELAQTHALSRWCHPTISSSVIPFSSCLQSLHIVYDSTYGIIHYVFFCLAYFT